VIRVAQTPRLVVLVLLLFTFQYFGDGGRPRPLCGLFLPCEFGIAILLFSFEAFVASFESPPCTLGTGFLIREFPYATFGNSKIGRERYVTRAYKIATTALDTVH
jgi:hypothetical protein